MYVIYLIVLLNILEKPTAPTNLKVTNVTPAMIELTWEAPEGGATVKQYIIVMREAQKKKFKKVGKADGSTLTFSVTSSLEGGHEYVVRVYAENEAGISEVAAEVSSPIVVPMEELKDVEALAKNITPVEVTKEKPEKVKEESEKVKEEPEKVKEEPEKVKEEPEKVKEEPEKEKEEPEKVKEEPEKVKEEPEKFKDEQEKDKDEPEKVKETPEKAEKSKEAVKSEKAKEEVSVEAVKDEVEKVKEKPTLPSAPRNVGIAKVTGDSIKVSWEAPETEGGTPLKSFVVAVRDAAKKKFKDIGKVDAKTLSFKVKKLKEGHEYFVKVYAESEAGLSKTAGELAAPVKVGLPIAQVSKITTARHLC